MSEIPKKLRYAATHEWALKEGEVVIVGITQHAAQALGDLVFIDLPGPGTAVTAGEAFGEIESVKAVSELNSPVTGKVVEVNEDLENNLETIGESPYEDGWMIKVEPTDPAELDELLDSAAYEKKLQEEE